MEVLSFPYRFVILVDSKKAKLLLFQKGSVVSYREVMHPGVRKKSKINSGEIYGRNDKLQRRREKQLLLHLQMIAQAAEEFTRHKDISSVFVGGHKQLIHKIEAVLPERLRENIKSEFVSELNIADSELLVKTRSITERYSEEYEKLEKALHQRP